MNPISKSYEPQIVEDKWYRYWEEENLFRADETKLENPYSIVIPPPNVTGNLHMGHALNNTLQDILCRYKRMNGYNVLWMPGTDHAGIATQNVVEKQLALEGLNRYDLGRERFTARVWEWKERYGGIIINQLKRLGASCDWSRERFTMDDGLSRAVRKVFVTLFDEGLIYRGDYIINWCPRCHTALADLEVDHHEIEGALYYIRYPFEHSNQYVVVATTRPETMLGDTAVCANPLDKRFSKYAGQILLLPLVGRKIPFILDSYVSMEFGTGVLKITPAHDLNDFEIGLRHNLESVVVIDQTGHMDELAGPYRGLDRFEARKIIVEDLKKQNLLEKIEPYHHNVGHCYRCKTMIEPLLSKQWFVRAKPLADAASDAVKNGATRIIPSIWEKTYFEWLNTIRDWCISRQIWWGHRIPAWYCKDCSAVIVAMEEPTICTKCGGAVEQDSDVLDTWFSSALWPFSTMGWPDNTPELKVFYPTSVLVTGFDILFFWVARMMMMGLHFMKDVPFRDVYIHALVRDTEGQKMSKSKGNVIDPLTIMDKYGTDAFRFTLAAFAAQGRDVMMSEERVEGYRHFVNKIWNAARFSLMNLEDYDNSYKLRREALTLADRWILSRLSRVGREAAQALEEYRFNDAAGTIYQFTWHEFCDWYVEQVKLVFSGRYSEEAKKTGQAVLHLCLSAIIKMLHPFMPFVTEELWSLLSPDSGSVMKTQFPKSEEWIDEDAEREQGLLMAIITGIRNIRGEMNVPPSKKVEAILYCHDQSILNLLKINELYIKELAKVESIASQYSGDRPKKAATSVVGSVEIFIPLGGIIDLEAETKRLAKEVEKVARDLSFVRKKLDNSDFLSRAPIEVVNSEREKTHTLEVKLSKLEENLRRVQALAGS
jgi:valyl-tRNA synthetase